MKNLYFIILFYILFSFNYSSAFSFRRTLNDKINLDYVNKDISANFELDNFYVKNNTYFLCGKLDYIVFNDLNNYKKKNFYLHCNEKIYQLYYDSIASVVLPWKRNNVIFNKSEEIRVYFALNNFKSKNVKEYCKSLYVDFK